mgnify:CR=1 FL=1
MMSHGPTLIYDKSTLQSLTAKEADWLHHHFHVVLTPTLFMEVLGNLKKESKRGKKPEEEVAILAAKIPNYAITPNMFYKELVIGDLVHEQVEMNGKPYLGGGKRVQHSDGSYGVFFEDMPESKALRLWQQGDFNALEHEMAAEWQDTLEELDLSAISQSMKWAESHIKNLKTPEEILAFIDKALGNDAYKILLMALQYLGVPSNHHARILARWQHFGRRPLPEFAPYAAYVLKVDLFFNFLITRRLISDQRASHKIDFTYFYYLPFTTFFTSNDKLHKQMAPLLLREDQRFIEQPALKKDMAALTEYYESLPEEVKKTGTRNYAAWPPREGDFLVSRLYDQVYGDLEPNWRKDAERKPEPRDPEEDKRILKRTHEIMDQIKADK